MYKEQPKSIVRFHVDEEKACSLFLIHAPPSIPFQALSKRPNEPQHKNSGRALALGRAQHLRKRGWRNRATASLITWGRLGKARQGNVDAQPGHSFAINGWPVHSEKSKKDN